MRLRSGLRCVKYATAATSALGGGFNRSLQHDPNLSAGAKMTGQQASAHDRLFYSFNLDSHVPSDHLLRRIHRFLDLSGLRRHLAPFWGGYFHA